MPGSPRTDIQAFQKRFGPAIDALLRDIDDRIAVADRPGLVKVLADWPHGPDGEPLDTDALYQRLLALQAGLPPPPPRMARRGDAVWGFVEGGLLALPLGGLVFLFLTGFFLLPRGLREALAAPGWVIGGVTLVGAMLGALHGVRPTRLGHAAKRGCAGLLLGGVAGALLGYAVFAMIGSLRNVSNFEGTYAMGVMFIAAPAAGLAGGVLVGGWMAVRGWRGWR